MLEEGPTTYSLGDLRDATKLAQKIVQTYGMTDMGITMHAPKQHAIGFMKRAFEVRIFCDKKGHHFGQTSMESAFQCELFV